MDFWRIFKLLIVITALYSLTGCFSFDLVSEETRVTFGETEQSFVDNEADTLDIEQTEQGQTEEQGERDIMPPNEIGTVMIIMYHAVTEGEPKSYLERTVEEFYSDLTNLYEDGYRIISMADLVNNNICIEAGYSPVILTFDDGWSSAFSLEDKNGILVPKENCAVDIINKFCEEHPDFGKGGVFYINGYMEPFIGDGTLEERFSYLIENGYELGNHTYSHKSLFKLKDWQIQDEIAQLDYLVRQEVPSYEILTLAYPYGERPKDGMKEYALAGDSMYGAYSYRWALREGPSGASAAPNNTGFDPLNVPRVRGTDNADMDFGWYLRYFRENPHLRYISDGNPNTISVPVEYEYKVNYDSFSDKELILY